MFLRTYPAAPIKFFFRTPAVPLSRFSLTAYFLCLYVSTHLPFCALKKFFFALFFSYTPRFSFFSLPLPCPYPSFRFSLSLLCSYLSSHPAALTLLCSYFSSHLPCCAFIPLFAYSRTLTLLCPYFSAHLIPPSRRHLVA